MIFWVQICVSSEYDIAFFIIMLMLQVDGFMILFNIALLLTLLLKLRFYGDGPTHDIFLEFTTIPRSPLRPARSPKDPPATPQGPPAAPPVTSQGSPRTFQ